MIQNQLSLYGIAVTPAAGFTLASYRVNAGYSYTLSCLFRGNAVSVDGNLGVFLDGRLIARLITRAATQQPVLWPDIHIDNSGGGDALLAINLIAADGAGTYEISGSLLPAKLKCGCKG